MSGSDLDYDLDDSLRRRYSRSDSRSLERGSPRSRSPPRRRSRHSSPPSPRGRPRNRSSRRDRESRRNRGSPSPPGLLPVDDIDDLLESDGEDEGGNLTEENSAPVEDASEDVEPVAQLQLCSKHKTDLQPESCAVCLVAVKHIPPAKLKDIVRASASVSDGLPCNAAARFQRSDEVTPSLIFSDTTMDLAVKVFTSGKFKLANHFEDLTKGYLMLPPRQHEQLNSNLMLEPTLRRIERQGKREHRPIFTFKNQVVRVIRDLRVTQVNFNQSCFLVLPFIL